MGNRGVYLITNTVENKRYIGSCTRVKSRINRHINLGSIPIKDLSKCMLENPNFLILDEPTNHLDLESITSLNKGLINFEGSILFTSRDHELNRTITNRVIEIKDDGTINDKYIEYDEFLEKRSN